MDESTDEQKQDLVRSLFTQVTYDLDTQRIVDYKLKPWAERFVVLRQPYTKMKTIIKVIRQKSQKPRQTARRGMM